MNCTNQNLSKLMVYHTCGHRVFSYRFERKWDLPWGIKVFKLLWGDRHASTFWLNACLLVVTSVVGIVMMATYSTVILLQHSFHTLSFTFDVL